MEVIKEDIFLSEYLDNFHLFASNAYGYYFEKTDNADIIINLADIVQTLNDTMEVVGNSPAAFTKLSYLYIFEPALDKYITPIYSLFEERPIRKELMKILSTPDLIDTNTHKLATSLILLLNKSSFDAIIILFSYLRALCVAHEMNKELLSPIIKEIADGK